MHATVGAEDAKNQAADAVREASPWLERYGRVGFAAKGVVYVIIATLAALAVFGMGGGATDTQGALEQLLQAPFGKLVLALVAVGLVGYAVWRLIQAGFDTEQKGTDLSGLWARGTYVIIGLVYLSLAFSAAELLVDLPGQASGGDRDSAKDWTAWLLTQPFGQWLAGGVGAVVVFSALFHFYRALTADFREKLKLGQMSDAQVEWATRLGRLGFAARGVAFAIIGGSLVLAAIRANPQEARGLDGALATLASQPFGPWLLGTVAAGLLAYGLYMFVEACYRRMVIR
jgi:hypothetical protein